MHNFLFKNNCRGNCCTILLPTTQIMVYMFIIKQNLQQLFPSLSLILSYFIQTYCLQVAVGYRRYNKVYKTMLLVWNVQITAEIRNNYIFIQPFLEFVMKSDSVSCVLVPKAYRPYTSAAVEHSDQQGKLETKTKQQQLTPPPTEQQTLWKHLLLKGQSGQFRQSEVEELTRILKTLTQEVSTLNAKLQSVQKRMAGLQSRQMQAEHPKKKIRRRACEIQKNYKCTYEGCSKSYGSQISLNLHIKLKHKQHGTDSGANSKNTDQESSGSHIESHQSSEIRNMSSN